MNSCSTRNPSILDLLTRKMMILFPLLLICSFSSVSGEIGELTWKHNLVTKKSIMENHLKVVSDPIFDKITSLVFITTYNPRGFRLVRLVAQRLSYVSPVWFNIIPIFEQNTKLRDIQIDGAENINLDFIRALRKLNPDIKIVPRFKFEHMDSELWELFSADVLLVQRTALKLADFCEEYGFEGLVLEIFNGLTALYRNDIHQMNTFESLNQIGKFLRGRGLTAILAIPAPIAIRTTTSHMKWLLIPAEETTELLKNFDYIQIWTYSDVLIHNREYASEQWFFDCMSLFQNSSKIMIGLNYYGTEMNLTEFDNGDYKSMKDITGKRYLELLEDYHGVLEWNNYAKEHELILKRNNTIAIFPSLTSLEWRMRVAREKNVAISFWDIGQGLDYFVNLV